MACVARGGGRRAALLTFVVIGAGATKGLPVLVTIPQLIGGGAVGLNIGDSIVRARYRSGTGTAEPMTPGIPAPGCVPAPTKYRL